MPFFSRWAFALQDAQVALLLTVIAQQSDQQELRKLQEIPNQAKPGPEDRCTRLECELQTKLNESRVIDCIGHDSKVGVVRAAASPVRRPKLRPVE